MQRRVLTICGVLAAVIACGSVTRAVIGSGLLPTGWQIVPPQDRVAATGTMPQGLAISSDGAWLFLLDGGAGAADLRVYDAQSLEQKGRVPLDGAFGNIIVDPSDGVWIGTANKNALARLDPLSGAVRSSVAFAEFWPATIALSPDRSTLAVTGERADAVAIVNRSRGTFGTVKVGRQPDGVAWSRDGKTIYVANWGESSISVVDAPARTVRVTIAVGNHPEAVLLSPDGATLYVSDTDDDDVAFIDTASSAVRTRVNVGLYGGKLYGASPSQMQLDAGGGRLYVVCGAANAIAVIDTRAARAIGAIRTGWYPTSLVLAPGGRSLYVTSGKGEGGHANPQFDPFSHDRAAREGYVATATIGSLRRIPIPSDAELANAIGEVQHQAPYLASSIASDEVERFGPPSPLDGRAVVSTRGPIHHVIYIIKENRTYDQVLGDMKEGDGDAALAFFGEANTPNDHALARRFGLFDRTFVNAQVSADGHNWSTAAFANDYLERMWPQVYGDRRDLYDFEDGARASTPHAGYLWDDATAAGVSFRNYGEFVTAPEGKPSPNTSEMRNLRDHTDPAFTGFDLTVPDQDRVDEWAREFKAYVANGQLPALEIVRLPSDHTAGTHAGAPTPQAMVADNDLAFGRVVDIVSHSPYWSSTAIFAIEDDAQNGPDHVDAQRTTLYVASPYAKPGLHHETYTTASVMRTIELILGLPPMSAYDAAAPPLYEAFSANPVMTPYTTLPERIDLRRRNGAAAYRAADSARLFAQSRGDDVPDAELNDILWHAARGAQPEPRYGTFARSP